MNERQLALIREFASICTAASIEFWLRGGWAMDFFLGRITRNHEDIDLFVWAEDAPRLAGKLQRSGFVELRGPPPEVQRDFTKNGEELQIALLDRNRAGEVVVAGGPWAGAPWPNGMLDGAPGRIGALVCPIVNPQVQIEIKEKFREWRPDLPQHEKHQADIASLRAALSRDK
ncbi:MAG TPA: aminoglycoside adenylyltransferase [Chloroflexota bacterium]